jgi:hypothetical protein
MTAFMQILCAASPGAGRYPIKARAKSIEAWRAASLAAFLAR